MFKTALMTVAAVATLSFGAVQANAQALSGDALRGAISGKTVFLNISGFELPVQYSPGRPMPRPFRAMRFAAQSVARPFFLTSPASSCRSSIRRAAR